MYRKGILLLIFTLVISTMVFAQRDQGGFIMPGDSLLTSLPADSMIYLPQNGFALYEVPAGSFKGKILPGPPLGSFIEKSSDSLLNSTLVGVTSRPMLISKDNYFETLDYRYYLSFDQQKEDYVLVFSESNPGWIALEEIKAKGFVIINWMQFFEKSKGLMIHPLNKIAPVLLSPKQEAKVVENADELFSEISLTGKCEESHCFVKVTQFRNPYDSQKSREENILKKYKGWIQIIDDNGKLLVALNSQSQQ